MGFSGGAETRYKKYPCKGPCKRKSYETICENVVSWYQTLVFSLPRPRMTVFWHRRPKTEFMTGPHRQPSKKETAFVFEECVKNLPYTRLQEFSYLLNSSNIYTELIVTVFDGAENRSALVWETVVWSLSKKSKLFYTYNNVRKNYTADYSFIASFLWFSQNVWVWRSQIEDSWANK